MRSSSARTGFTLVELLVAMGILAVLISAVIALSGSFLGYSRHANVINMGIADLNDVSGYIATNARRALRGIGCQDTPGTAGNPNDPAVTCGVESSVTISFGGSPFICSTESASGPCIALVVPVVDRSSATANVIDYELLAYRVVPLSEWSGNPGVAPGWNGTETPTLLEYRASLGCGATCATPPATPLAVTAAAESLVATDLFFEDENGATLRPFQVVTDPLSSNLKLQAVTFRLRTRGAGLERDVILPTRNTLVVTATSRP